MLSELGLCACAITRSSFGGRGPLLAGGAGLAALERAAECIVGSDAALQRGLEALIGPTPHVIRLNIPCFERSEDDDSSGRTPTAGPPPAVPAPRRLQALTLESSLLPALPPGPCLTGERGWVGRSGCNLATCAARDARCASSCCAAYLGACLHWLLAAEAGRHPACASPWPPAGPTSLNLTGCRLGDLVPPALAAAARLQRLRSTGSASRALDIKRRPWPRVPA